MVLYCRPIAKLCMCKFGPVKMQGAQKGIVENSPPPPLSPLKIGSGKLVLDKKKSPPPPDKLNAYSIGVIEKNV